MSGLPESGHGWAIYEHPFVAAMLIDKLRRRRPLRLRGGRWRRADEGDGVRSGVAGPGYPETSRARENGWSVNERP